MSTRFRLSPRATSDLDEIWHYTETRWGAGQAEIYLSQIRDAVVAISRDPHRGRACDDIRPGYKRYAVGAHALYYRIAGGTVVIIRILHRRMDTRRHI